MASGEYNARVVDNISLAARTKVPAVYIDPATGNELYNREAVAVAELAAALTVVEAVNSKPDSSNYIDREEQDEILAQLQQRQGKK